MHCDYCSTIKGVGPKTALRLIKQHKSLERIIEVLKKEKKYSIPPDWAPMRVSKNEEDKVENEEGHEDEIEDEMAPDDAEDEEVEDLLGESSLKAVTEETNAESEAKEATSDSNEAKEEEVPLVEDENYEIVEPLFAQARKLFVNCEVTDAETLDLKWNEPDEAGLMSFLVERMGFNAERVAGGIKKLKEAQQQKAQKRMDSFFTSMGTIQSSTGKRKAEEVKGKGGKPDAKKPFFGKKK